MRNKKGRKPRTSRNLEICRLVDEGKMLLQEIGEIYGIQKSRISQIVNVNWKEYIKQKYAKRKHNP